jgi:hypothetical protein
MGLPCSTCSTRESHVENRGAWPPTATGLPCFLMLCTKWVTRKTADAFVAASMILSNETEGRDPRAAARSRTRFAPRDLGARRATGSRHGPSDGACRSAGRMAGGGRPVPAGIGPGGLAGRGRDGADRGTRSDRIRLSQAPEWETKSSCVPVRSPGCVPVRPPGPRSGRPGGDAGRLSRSDRTGNFPRAVETSSSPFRSRPRSDPGRCHPLCLMGSGGFVAPIAESRPGFSEQYPLLSEAHDPRR